jgi:hypothetical protein
MTVISYPKCDVLHMHMTDVFLRADTASVTQYCIDYGVGTLSSYTAESQRFSNDGSLTYQYYDGSKWMLEDGYAKIVISLVVT